MINSLRNKSPQELVDLLDMYEDDQLQTVLENVAVMWFEDYFAGQSPFQIKNLIRNIKSSSPSFILLLSTIQKIGAELITAKEEEIKIEKMMRRENINTQKDLQKLICLVDIAKEILRKNNAKDSPKEVAPDKKKTEPLVDPRHKEKPHKSKKPRPDNQTRPLEQPKREPVREVPVEKKREELPQRAPQPKVEQQVQPKPKHFDEDEDDFFKDDDIPETAPVKAAPVAPKREEPVDDSDDDFDDDEDFEDEEVVEKKPKTTTTAEDLATIDEEFSPSINNTFVNLKRLSKDRINKLGDFSSELAELNELLQLPKNADTALKIADKFSKKTLREIFEFTTIAKLDHEDDNNFLVFILGSFIHSHYIPLMDINEIDMEFEQITALYKNTQQLVNIYYNLWLINKKLFPITSNAIRKARSRNDTFNISVLVDELEKEKLLILILEELLTYKFGIKLKTDAMYKKQIETANINLILHFALQNYSNSTLIPIYYGYGYFRDDLKDEPKEAPATLMTQLSLYKPGNTAKELFDIMLKAFRLTSSEELGNVFNDLFPGHLDVDPVPFSKYPMIVRDCVQGVLKAAIANSWEMDETLYHLALSLITRSKHNNSYHKLGYIAYHVVQELILGSQNYKYKIDKVVNIMARVYNILLVKAPTDELKELFQTPKAVEYFYRNIFESFFDTLIEIYESISLAQNTAKSFCTMVTEEKDKAIIDTQKHKLREFIEKYG